MNNEISDKEKIRNFVQLQLSYSQINIELTDDTPLLTSGLLDSLIMVDLVLFFEESFPDSQLTFDSIKKDDIDTINQIYHLVQKR